MQTTARIIASRYCDDGRVLVDGAGVHIERALALVSRRQLDLSGSGIYRYEFTDGSAILVSDTCWNIEGPRRFEWAV